MKRYFWVFLLMLFAGFAYAQESQFDSKKSRDKLVKGHFFDPHYDWKNQEINTLLLRSKKQTRVGNALLVSGLVSTLFVVGIITGPIAITIGSIIKQKGRKLFWQATLLRNEALTHGQKHSGSELFRTPSNARWFYRKNFHVQYYDGSNPKINENLLLSIQHHQLAKKRSKWMMIFGSAGLTLAYIAGDNFFANALSRDGRSDRNVWLPVTSSVTLGFIGLKFLSASGKGNTRAYRHLEIATYQWYDDKNRVK